jgi:hypothetical protein
MRACIGIYVAEMGEKLYNNNSIRQCFRRHIMLLKCGEPDERTEAHSFSGGWAERFYFD